MRIAISGPTGLIGSRLVSFFAAEEHEVIPIARHATADGTHASTVIWDPARRHFPASELEGVDAVIHLSGANISERWTESYKKEILQSRIQTTKLLCTGLAGVKNKPRVLLSASATGYYGNHPADVTLDELSPVGNGFLADVCRQWETETRWAESAGIRVVHMRFGVVLSRAGGALAKMLPAFQWGAGGVLGDGHQMMSWIALDEIPLIVAHLLKDDKLSGAINMVSPHPVSNQEFTRVLGKVIKRPTVFPVPAFMIKALFGEMGETLLLEGNKVIPKRLQESQYNFKYPDLTSALQHAIIT